MAARNPTGLEQLTQIGRYIDHALLPTLNDVPAILGALLYGETATPVIEQGRKDGKGDAEIAHEVAHAIAPPDPDAGATVTQGVPVEAHQRLQDEVSRLSALVEQLAGQRLQAARAEQGGNVAPTQFAQPPSQAAQGVQDRLASDPKEAELAQLREQAQRLALRQAQAQQTTVEQVKHDAEQEAPDPPPADDPRDQELAELRAIVAQLEAPPQGEQTAPIPAEHQQDVTPPADPPAAEDAT